MTCNVTKSSSKGEKMNAGIVYVFFDRADADVVLFLISMPEATNTKIGLKTGKIFS